MNPFKHYRESVIIKDTIKCHHISIGEGSYYSGYYHGKHFEECVMYLDEIDNKTDPSKIDKLIIGKFCSIASGVQFMMGGNQGHDYNWIAVHPLTRFENKGRPAYKLKGDTIIGNDVWLGAETLIMPGIKIADGAVIATRSVVTKNVGPYEIWGGNPAKFIKKRFSDDKIGKLLQIKWWDWDEKTIEHYLNFLRSDDIDGLWEKYLSKNL